jgi:hypothetical protein
MKKQTRKAAYSKGYATGRKFDKAIAFYLVIGILIGALIVFIAALVSGL